MVRFVYIYIYTYIYIHRCIYTGMHVYTYLTTLTLTLNLTIYPPPFPHTHSYCIAMIAMSAQFSVMLLVSTTTYNGAYEIFLDFSSFFSTFTTTALMPGSALGRTDSTTVHTPPCLAYNPVGIFKAAITIYICSTLLQIIVLRASLVEFSCVYECIYIVICIYIR